MPPVDGRPSSIFSLEALEIRRFLTAAFVDASRVLQINGTGSGETIFVNRLKNGRVSITGVSSQFRPGSGSGQFNKININAGGGNDRVTISSNVPYSSATISGGNGNDVLIGGKGNDSIGGGNGKDTLDGGGGGADILSGGAGFDTANYSHRTESLTITLDGKANDGANGGKEKDNVQTEELISGSGNDRLTGSNGEDFIAGGAGNDTIFGLGGNDKLIGSTGADQVFGNDGDDVLQVKNQDRDTVNGGTNSDGSKDFDLASIDSIDRPGISNNEPVADEGVVEEIEEFLSDDVLIGGASFGPLVDQLINLSESSRLYVFGQPNTFGEVTINLTDAPDTVIFSKIQVNGETLLALDINGVILTYDPDTTTRFDINLAGGNDLLQASSSVRVPLNIHGGRGNDTIIGGARNDSLFGGDGNDVLKGAERHDALVGGPGRDTLFGGDGRDILIGGDHADNLYGERGQDILIGGVTIHDNDGFALGEILAEWTNDRNFKDRVNNLRNGGGLNGSFILSNGPERTLAADKGGNFLNSGYDTDWFFKGPNDRTKHGSQGDLVDKA